jgi:zinc protease
MLSLILMLGCPKPLPPAVDAVPHPLDDRPTVGPTVDYTPPTPQVFTASGITVWLVERDDLPLVEMRLVVPGGSALDGDLPGLASFADDMLTHGAGSRDSTAFATVMEQNALSLGVSTGDTNSYVSLSSHKDRLDVGMALLSDAILAPTFEADEVDRMRELVRGDLQSSQDDARTVAVWSGDVVYFGEGHPLATTFEGNLDALDRITPDALRESWSSRFVATGSTLMVSGDLSQHEIEVLLEQSLGEWDTSDPDPTAPETTVPTGLPEPAATPGCYTVDMPGSSQSTLRVLLPGWMLSDDDRVAAELATIVLGGTFTSRLNRLLREELGYTYGARASTGSAPTYGRLVASTSVRQDVTGDALKQLLETMDLWWTQGIDDAELRKAQGSYQTDVVASMEGRASIAGTFAWAAASSQTPESVAQDLVTSSQVTVEQANAAVGKLSLDQAVIVVVGDLAAIAPQLEASVPEQGCAPLE